MRILWALRSTIHNTHSTAMFHIMYQHFRMPLCLRWTFFLVLSACVLGCSRECTYRLMEYIISLNKCIAKHLALSRRVFQKKIAVNFFFCFFINISFFCKRRFSFMLFLSFVLSIYLAFFPAPLRFLTKFNRINEGRSKAEKGKVS